MVCSIRSLPLVRHPTVHIVRFRDRSISQSKSPVPTLNALRLLRSAPAPLPPPSPATAAARSDLPSRQPPASTNRLPMVPGALMPLQGASVASALLRPSVSPESRSGGLVLQGSQFQKNQANCISFKREVSTKATLRSVICSASQTQTQSVQRKSSTATVKRSDPKGKVQGPKLDDGSGGFPPFRFGKGGGGGGGGGGGSNYFGGFLLFTIVLLLDYLKEFEKHLAARRHIAGDDDHASNGLLEQ